MNRGKEHEKKVNALKRRQAQRDMVGWEGGLVGAMFAGAWGVKVVLIWIVGVVLVVRL